MTSAPTRPKSSASLAEFVHLVTRLKLVPEAAQDAALTPDERARGQQFCASTVDAGSDARLAIAAEGPARSEGVAAPARRRRHGSGEDRFRRRSADTGRGVAQAWSTGKWRSARPQRARPGSWRPFAGGGHPASGSGPAARSAQRRRRATGCARPLRGCGGARRAASRHSIEDRA